MDNLVKGYSERTIRALTDCAAGRRDVVIADDSKSQCSINELRRVGREMGLEVVGCRLVSDNGAEAAHAIFGRHVNDCYRAYNWIIERKAGNISRIELQAKLGTMLGYRADDAVEFMGSEIGQTCPCDCCGGES